MPDWIDLGVITPVLNDWRFFPEPMVGGSAVRVKFLGLNGYPLYFRTYVVIRPVYAAGDGQIRGLGKRFFPSLENTDILTEFPVPENLMDQGYAVRDFEIKKFLRRPYIGRSGEPNYSVQLFDYATAT